MDWAYVSTQFCIILFAVILYYHFGKVALFAGAGHVVRYFGLAKRYSLEEAKNSVELALAGSSHIVFIFVLMLITKVHLAQLGLAPFQPLLLLYGVLLGIGEMAFASFICRVVISIAMLVMPGKVPSELKDWLTMARAGWMRHYLRTVEIAPVPLLVLLITMQVASEEVVFRSVLISYFLSAGIAWALVASTFFFVLMQVFQMPSWSSALFPVVGALVMGLVHGTVFISVPYLPPLIIAHLVFFTIAVL